MKILIVGAGIAGLAAAKALELRGYCPEIVERRARSPADGQSIFLLGNAMRALASLGLQDKVYELSFPIHAQTILSSRGSVLNQMRTAAVWDGCGPCVSIVRRSLVETMNAALTHTRVRFGTTVMTSVATSERRAVQFSDGRTSVYDLVIGADGIRSSMRAVQFPKSAPRSIGLSAWRLSVENKYGIDHWIAMLGTGRTLLAIPLPDGKLYLYADCPTKQFADGSLAVMKRLFRNFANPLGSIVADLGNDEEAHCADLEEVPMRDYASNRLVLIGDAAHASSPSMAQGAGMAIEDAVVLADCVSGNEPLDQALARFCDIRRGRVEWVQKQSHARDKLRTAPGFIRNAILRTMGARLYHRSYGMLAEPIDERGTHGREASVSRFLFDVDPCSY